METKLIMLPNPIVVSDEEIKEGDFMYLKEYHPQGQIRKCHYITDEQLMIDAYEDIGWGFCRRNEVYKIIAGIESLPKLDLSLVTEEIGWVDVEKLAESVHPNPNPDNLTLTNTLQLLKNNYISGFKAAQSLSKPKEYLVEVEMEVNQCDGCISGHHIIDGIHKAPYPSGSMVCKKHLYDRPKITNNTIKVTKVL